MVKLGVNVDHIATIREARKAPEPDPVAAALLAELAGADGITVHLRGDRRHIKERDVRLLREVAFATTIASQFQQVLPSRFNNVPTQQPSSFSAGCAA